MKKIMIEKTKYDFAIKENIELINRISILEAEIKSLTEENLKRTNFHTESINSLLKYLKERRLEK